MRFPLLFIFFVFYLPIRTKTQSPDGIDSEDGDAEMFFNKTYTEHLTALQKKIFNGYQNTRRPVRNESQPTLVDVHWHIVHLSVNAIDQTLTMHGHLYMRWFDEFLIWKPEEFNGVRIVRCKKWQVWQPKVKVANSASGVSAAFDFATNAHVHIQMQESGRSKVEMYPTFSVKVGCAFDFADFPDDINRCSLSIFPTVSMAEIQLQVYYQLPPTLSFAWASNITTKKKRIISNYEVLNVTTSQIYYAGGNISKIAPFTENELAYTWSMLSTTVIFKRHSPYFSAGIAVPSLITAIINSLCFFIPSPTFASYCLMSNLLIQAVFLQDMIKKLPLAVTHVPDCVKLYSFIMVSNVLSIFLHAYFIYLTTSKLPPKMPDFLKNVYHVKEFFPESWRKKDEEENQASDSWHDFLKVFRPMIGTFLSIIYAVQCFVFLVF